MNNTSNFQHDDTNELKELFLGRKVINISEDNMGHAVLALDNGAIATVIPNQGSCCSNGDYFLTSIKEFDHVITNVKVESVERYESPNDNGWGDGMDHRYSLYFYSAGISAGDNAVVITGSDGNGYYGTGFEIKVTIGEKVE